jgi:hypothetical protein
VAMAARDAESMFSAATEFAATVFSAAKEFAPTAFSAAAECPPSELLVSPLERTAHGGTTPSTSAFRPTTVSFHRRSRGKPPRLTAPSRGQNLLCRSHIHTRATTVRSGLCTWCHTRGAHTPRAVCAIDGMYKQRYKQGSASPRRFRRPSRLSSPQAPWMAPARVQSRARCRRSHDSCPWRRRAVEAHVLKLERLLLLLFLVGCPSPTSPRCRVPCRR